MTRRSLPCGMRFAPSLRPNGTAQLWPRAPRSSLRAASAIACAPSSRRCSRSSPIRPEISVLIPSASGGDRLAGLAGALLAGSPSTTEVLVADNGLNPDVRAALRAAGIEVVEMGGNAGYGRAVNRVAQRAA